MSWFYSDDQFCEVWLGRCATREEAIAEGIAEYSGEPFFVADGALREGAYYFPDARNLVEIAANEAHDTVGDVAEDWLEGCTEAALDELDLALKNVLETWLKKHDLEPRFEVVDGEAERIEPKVTP